MAIYIRESKRTEWCPDCSDEKEARILMNLGFGNQDPNRIAERRFAGTVNSTARMLAMLETDKLTAEDFYQGVSKNAEHIGISEEELLDLAAQKLAEKENEA